MKKRFEEAIEAFKISETAQPSSEYVYYELAGLYAQIGNNEKETEYMQKFKDNGGSEI